MRRLKKVEYKQTSSKGKYQCSYCYEDLQGKEGFIVFKLELGSHYIFDNVNIRFCPKCWRKLQEYSIKELDNKKVNEESYQKIIRTSIINKLSRGK